MGEAEGRDTDAAVAPLFSTVFISNMHGLEVIKPGREADAREAGASHPERCSSDWERIKCQFCH